MDLLVIAAEPSADLLGAHLLEELLQLDPSLRIAAVAGPKMRRFSQVELLFPMETLQVMGFVDVLLALPRLIRRFSLLKRHIAAAAPKAVVSIDYPGFNLQLVRRLRKAGYRGTWIHLVCPTVWAWKKKRIPQMAKTLDLLLTLFPFEKALFAGTSLAVEYVGHPLTSAIAPSTKQRQSHLLGLFPGSRKATVARNFPLQLEVAKKLLNRVKEVEVAVSIAHPECEAQIRSLAGKFPLRFFPPEKNYELMQTCRLALATSGTVTLELALHETPTVVHYAISPIDLFLAKRIFQIDLPFYCIANIVLQQEIFPELIGPHFTEENLLEKARALWESQELREKCQAKCREMRQQFGEERPSRKAALKILELLSSSMKSDRSSH